jgi:hypothetical protein
MSFDCEFRDVLPRQVCKKCAENVEGDSAERVNDFETGGVRV